MYRLEIVAMPDLIPSADNLTPENTRIRDQIIELIANCDAGKSVCPSEVARAINGNDEKAWRLLMKPIRQQAVILADQGEISIIRKGKLADPHDFKGVYRLGAPAKPC